MTADWIPVVVGTDQSVPEVARALLLLADDARDVRTSHGGRSFRVAPYVAERYTRPARKRRAPKTDKDES